MTLPSRLMPAAIVAIAALLAGCAAEAPAPARIAAVEPASTIDRATVFGMIASNDASTAGGNSVATEDVAPGLEFVCLVRLPTGSRPLTVQDLASLGLDRAAVITLAKANMAAGLRPIDEITTVPPNGEVGRIAGDYAEAGRLALHESWDPLAYAMAGKLIVAAPAANILLYADGRAPDAVERVRVLARDIKGHAARPLSDLVLRWSRTGWDLASQPAIIRATRSASEAKEDR